MVDTDKLKYTVSLNDGEFARGVFDTYEQAEAFRAKLISERYPDEVEPDMPQESILEIDADGYFTIMHILLED